MEANDLIRLPRSGDAFLSHRYHVMKGVVHNVIDQTAKNMVKILSARIEPDNLGTPLAYHGEPIQEPLRHVFTEETALAIAKGHKLFPGIIRRNGEWVAIYRFACSCGQRHALVWESGDALEAELACHVCQRVNVVMRPQ